MAILKLYIKVRKIDDYGGVYEINDDNLVRQIIDMYHAACDLMNDPEHGGIRSLNDIWHWKHPHEAPDDSEDLRREYDLLHRDIYGRTLRFVSWTYGLDFENGCRWQLLEDIECETENGEETWVYFVIRHDL